ncbi:unnamed protein product, partial [Musa acuminata subsp. burmannicoides]
FLSSSTLTPSNILVDESLNPRYQILGWIARIFQGDEIRERATRRPMGTIRDLATMMEIRVDARPEARCWCPYHQQVMRGRRRGIRKGKRTRGCRLGLVVRGVALSTCICMRCYR